MMDPFADIDRRNRELADSPWGPPQRLRAQWREPDRARHLRVEDFEPAFDPLAWFVKVAGIAICAATLLYFAWRLLRP